MGQYVTQDTTNRKAVSISVEEIGKLSPAQHDSLRFLLNEMPGTSIYLALPDEWKDIDPFAGDSLTLRLPKRTLTPVPEYLRFSQGMVGYYFAHQEIGIYGYGWSTLDSLRAQGIRFSLPDERGIWTPNVLKALGISKSAMIILALLLLL